MEKASGHGAPNSFHQSTVNILLNAVNLGFLFWSLLIHIANFKWRLEEVQLVINLILTDWVKQAAHTVKETEVKQSSYRDAASTNSNPQHLKLSGWANNWQIY